MSRRNLFSERTQARFWAQVETYGRDPDRCWPWRGAILKAPGRGEYGKFSRNPSIRAHIYSWALAHGHRFPPKGKVIAHTCDNPPCVNPNHLVKTTQLKNVADMLAKGRGVLVYHMSLRQLYALADILEIPRLPFIWAIHSVLESGTIKFPKGRVLHPKYYGAATVKARRVAA